MDSRYAILPGFTISALLIGFLSSGFRPLINNQIIDKSEQSVTVVNNHPSVTLNSYFPESIQQWASLITLSASEYRLDPNLVAAVMLQESGGNPNAYSSSGAVGLLQVMPRDGLSEAFLCNGNPCFSNRPSMAELYDPQFNIMYGSRMLAGLIQRTGSLREALKAYGPMDVAYSYADRVISIYQSTQ